MGISWESIWEYRGNVGIAVHRRPAHRRRGARPSLHRADRRLLGLLPRDHRKNPMPTVLDVENELVRERLVVFLAELLGPLREVIPRLNLHALERRDELRRVITTADTGLL